MVAAVSPLLIRDQMVFCFWLRGDAKVQLALVDVNSYL
jgi:hypothetical protein